MALSLKDRFKRVDKHLIGLWRFRERGKSTCWYATYTYKGDYYDVAGGKTPESALNAVHRELRALKDVKGNGAKKFASRR